MAPSRARSERPSASQRLALRPEAAGILARQMRKQPPPYVSPKYPLSTASRRKLDVLVSRYKRRNLAIKHAKALKQLSDCAFDVNRTLVELQSAVDKEKKKAEKGAQDTNVDAWQEKLDAFRPKHQNLSKRLEKYARTCVDLTQRHESLTNAATRSAEAAPLGHTQRLRATRNTQAESMSSFEPTLPGATAEEDVEGDSPMVEVESILEKFRTRRREEVENWTAKSLLDRYGHDVGYTEFKEQEHEGYYGDDQEVPPSTRWFETEEPAPGTATQGAADESDDDVQVARSKISTKCPLTLREFEDPVMSMVCKHTFEKSAIYEMIGKRPQVQCPVGGCPNHITRSQLAPNAKLLRKIRRIQQSRNRLREEIDDERSSRGQNADRSILLSDGVDTEGFQSLDSELNLKREARSQSRAPPKDSAESSEEDGDDTEDEE